MRATSARGGRGDRGHRVASSSARRRRSAAPALSSLAAASSPASLGVGRRGRLVAQPRRAVGQADERAQHDAVLADRRVRAERGVAARVEARRRACAPRAARPTSATSVIARAADSARLVVDAALQHERPLARARHEIAQQAADLRLATEPDQAGCGEHQRVDLAVGELAQARVDVAAELDDVEVRRAARAAAPRGARWPCPRARPPAARPATRRRPARRAGRRAAGAPTSSSPSGNSLGTSFALCTARSMSPASSASSSSLTQRSLSRTRGPAALRSPRRRDRDQLGVAANRSATVCACASASGLARVPILTAKRGAAAGARCRARRPARPRATASSGAPSSPNSSRMICRRPWLRPSPSVRRCSVGSCSSRFMTERATASTRAQVALGDRLPAVGVLGQHLLDDRVAVVAQRADRRLHGERPEPLGEARDLLLDNRLGAQRLGLANRDRVRDARLQVVHVVERHAVQVAAGGVDVARHGDVDEQQRAAAAGAHDELELLLAEDRMRRRGRGDDDVGAHELRGQLVERDDAAVEALGQRARAVGVAVGDEDRAHAAAGQRLRRQLARLAGADDHDVRVGLAAEDVHRELDGDRRDRRAPVADRGLRAHSLAGLQRRREEAVGQRTGRAGRQRLLVGALDLALDLGLADDHRLQAAGDAKQLARGVAVARRVDRARRARSGARARAGRASPARRSRRARGRRRRASARCGCRSRSTTASWTSGCSATSCRKPRTALCGQREALAQLHRRGLVRDAERDQLAHATGSLAAGRLGGAVAAARRSRRSRRPRARCARA